MTDLNTPLTFLHGFLGDSKDWGHVITELAPAVAPETPSLFSRKNVIATSISERSIRDSLDRGLSLADSARAWVAAVKASDESLRKVGQTVAPRVWVGYSLGGRLLLHAALEGLPASGFVFVSTGLGIASIERAARLAQDEAWAERFDKEDWNTVVAAWNAQDVLTPAPGAPEPPFRGEADNSRARLSSALRAWSLARQQDLRERLSELRVPTLWLAGEHDAKYQGLVNEAVKRVRGAKSLTIQGAGHRIPREAPGALAAAIRSLGV